MIRLAPALALMLLPSTVHAANLTFTVTGGKTDETNVVCTVALPDGYPGGVWRLKLPDGEVRPLQIVKPSLLQPQGKASYVTFVLPKLPAGKPVTLTLTTPDASTPPPPTFRFVEDKEHTDLRFGGGPVEFTRPVLRYFRATHNPADHFYTFKPFHHVFDPAEGKTLLTNGAAKTPKDGLYPHHRGLFYGWNKISYDGKTADIWHGTGNVFSQHDKVLSEQVGPVLGRQLSAISWHGKDGQTFATEEREMTAYAVPGGTLIDFASVLRTDRPSVILDGDPQHAGFHFRANMEVSKNGKENTYYLRPDGKGKPGDTRNWDPKKADPKTVNLPWDAVSFVTGGKRYTVLRINHPDNPKEARGSERDYGRFGDYFRYELKPDHPLRVKYRVWVQDGEMTVEQCNAMAAAFVGPPQVKTGK